MEKLILKAKKREVFGKQNKNLRRQGIIPAVVYGAKTKPLALQLDIKEFQNIFHQAGDNTIIDLIIEDTLRNNQEIKNVLIYDIEKHYLTSQPLHIDFYEVQMDRTVTTHIPLVIKGDSPAVKMGGILVKSMDSLEIESLPKDLPHEIEVDISSLTEFGETLYVKDLAIPQGVKVLVSLTTPVVTVSAPSIEEEKKEEKEVSVEEVVIETEEKKQKRELERSND